MSDISLAAYRRSEPPLFGRERELAVLDASFNRAVAGEPVEFLFVSGGPGTGKTSLVLHWCERLAAPHRLVMLTCDEVNQSVPYAPVARMLRELYHAPFREGGRQCEAAPARPPAQSAYATAAPTPVAPELEVLFGGPPASDDANPQIERRALLHALASLVRMLGAPDLPLVLFFDDLQWADEGTLSALAYLQQNLGAAHAFVVGAFRNTEVDPWRRLHPLVNPQCSKAAHIALAPLRRADTARLIASTFACICDESHPLVELIDAKTGGHPFFTIQFVMALAEEGLIRLRNNGALQVDNVDADVAADLNAIRAHTHNLYELLHQRLNRLPQAARDSLRALSCLGIAATSRRLSIAKGQPDWQMLDALKPTLSCDLVQQDGERYRFAHALIREAAYHSMGNSERDALHLSIARRLLDGTENAAAGDMLYTIVDQFNAGVDAVTSATEVSRIAELNIMAGKRAKYATGYASALSYFANAGRLLGGTLDCNTRQWVEFHRAECEHLLAQHEAAEMRLAALSEREIELPLRAKLIRLALGTHAAGSHLERSLLTGLDYLRRLGHEIPAQPPDALVEHEYRRFMELVDGRGVEELAGLPTVTDPVWRSTLEILVDLLPLARFTNVNLRDLILLKAANLSLEHGISDASAYAFAALIYLFSGRYRDYARAHEFGQLAIRIVDPYIHSRFKARIYVRFGSVILPWIRPWSEGIAYLELASKMLPEADDPIFKASCARKLTSVLLLAGAPLDDVCKEAEKGFAFASASRLERYAATLGAQLAYLRTLRETGLKRIQDEREAVAAAQHETGGIDLARCCCDLASCFIFGDIAGALAAERAIRPLLQASWSNPEVAEYYFYAALSCAAAYASATTGEQRSACWDAIEAHRAQLAMLAEQCPANFAGRYALVTARIAELSGNVLQAERLYSEAIEHAKAHGFRQVHAIANELAAGLYASRGLEPVARSHLRDACTAYASWGAHAKVHDLNVQYRSLLQFEPRIAPARPSGYPLQQLDIGALMRSTHALASEIVLHRLIEALVTTALEHAGAQRCVLVSLSQAGLQVEAQARVHGDQIEVSIDKLKLSLANVPFKVLEAVTRSSRPLVLDNAIESGSFIDDEYVLLHQSRSIACTPLVNQGNLVAVLYLENDLVVGAFTEAKAAMLTVLGSQAAIALENARIYHDLIEESRRRAEAEEALRDALANFSRVARLTTMGEMAASIVHEVTQPITAINTSCTAAMRWLNREPESPSIVEAKAMIRVAMDECARASHVIRGLRDLAKKSEPEFSVFDLHLAISEVLALMRGQLNDNGIILDLRLLGECPVKGDRVQIQQVMLNLMANAIEAMSCVVGRGRLLTVSTESADKDTVCVRVADTGPGLEPSFADRVFDPFVTTKKSGMGMGLSICRSIVESHGGKLAWALREPFGTVFLFTLPAFSA
jgi:predicted ATPase/signal transduction histidine kinase